MHNAVLCILLQTIKAAMWCGKYLSFLFIHHIAAVSGLNCDELFNNRDIQYIDWSNLEHCLIMLGGKSTPQNVSEHIWRLTKIAFGGLENILPEAYERLGGILPAIPMQDLHNISMERVEIVEAFGAIRKKSKYIAETSDVTFNEEQMRLIAGKVRNEWLGKTPKTYSEYDLMSMGQIICHLNVTDILQIHADAFRFAAEWLGELQNCPQDRLQAFAELAIREDAFGKPNTWSKIVVSIIGNILNGLSQTDIEAIGKDKLYLNLYYRKQSHNSSSYKQKTTIMTTPTATASKENSTATNLSGDENIYT